MSQENKQNIQHHEEQQTSLPTSRNSTSPTRTPYSINIKSVAGGNFDPATPNNKDEVLTAESPIYSPGTGTRFGAVCDAATVVIRIIEDLESTEEQVSKAIDYAQGLLVLLKFEFERSNKVLLSKAVVLRRLPQEYLGRKKELERLAFQDKTLRGARKHVRVKNDRIRKALDCRLGQLHNWLAPDRCHTHVIYRQKLIPSEAYCRCDYREETQRDLCHDPENCLGYSCEHCSADRWRMRTRRRINHHCHQRVRVQNLCSRPDSDSIDSLFEDTGDATEP